MAIAMAMTLADECAEPRARRGKGPGPAATDTRRSIGVTLKVQTFKFFRRSRVGIGNWELAVVR